MNNAILPRHVADLLARKITDALVGLGAAPTELGIEAREVGLLITAVIHGARVAVVLPPDHKAEYLDVAATLLQEANMMIVQPKTPRTIFDD
jgi:hypothetical protein